MPLTYSGYLKLPKLLDLQEVLSNPPEHDEALFIIIHQTYELWFKLLLHELEKVGRDFSQDDLYGAIATFKRARMVMKILVGQFDILETMTPMSFTHFRNHLDSSAAQSTQFRELEFFLGYKRPELINSLELGDPGVASVQKRLKERSLIDHFYDFLEYRGVKIPAELRQRDRTLAAISDKEVQNGLLSLYETKPEVAILFELMTDFDEGLQEWRYRHVKLVERMIGDKPGTGGSSGVAYLRETLFRPLFADLWAIRHML
jgi:tryptophan 2,3-dioxygenase